jgi:UPF0271 protein
MRFDLNCDLGEGEPLEKTEALMRSISSANIACGGHAGDEKSMRDCLLLAREFGVHAGAHPGIPDCANFGRSDSALSTAELESFLEQQITTLQAAAADVGMDLHHVKLHGALYHLTEANASLRKVYLETMKTRWPNLIIFALAGGALVKEAIEFGLEAWPEAFLDRGYLPDGSLVPRADPRALVTEPEEIEPRIKLLLDTGEIIASDGTRLALSPKTLCVHSDSPRSIEIAALARRRLIV